jgi:hypothetical protein
MSLTLSTHEVTSFSALQVGGGGFIEETIMVRVLCHLNYPSLILLQE